MNRSDVTALILEKKLLHGLSWKDLSARLGVSKEWSTAALLGQMPLSAEQARVVTHLLELPEEVERILQEVPSRGCLPTAIPTDPTIYRFYEILQVYGTTIKELIHEEFGDGIMSAIDFSIDISRVTDEHGDRIKVTMNGKYLKYKTY
ncbi:cyanase [Acidithiobacillus sp. HP-6]|uniref:cyanase n=1 Tax=unclassified Acidithiobacillus TaxID=2614800 RepID=UPI00187A5C9A|nr:MULTISPECIES: cyanase [unclassified Acidithiobacillus]MBE7564273.1 cyanase [Acidithiobacillus sp. HP-6]MBE7570187.1 cyanase [Acidithiobacillus sp. HP-2]